MAIQEATQHLNISVDDTFSDCKRFGLFTVVLSQYDFCRAALPLVVQNAEYRDTHRMNRSTRPYHWQGRVWGVRDARKRVARSGNSLTRQGHSSHVTPWPPFRRPRNFSLEHLTIKTLVEVPGGSSTA